MVRTSRRTFLHQASLATVLAGVPAWALTEAGSAMASSGASNGTLTVVLNPEPPTLVSFANTGGTCVTASSKVLEGLLEYDHDLTPRPQLATSWSMSPDGLT